MDLSEIEAKADEYLTEVLATDSDAAAGSWLYRLMALEHVAKIKQVADQRAQWNAHVAMRNEDIEMRGREISAMEVAADAAARATAPQQSADGAEPTKPTVDRLHELVSYLERQAEEHSNMPAGSTDYHLGVADGVRRTCKDAAGKLYEILMEGGL